MKINYRKQSVTVNYKLITKELACNCICKKIVVFAASAKNRVSACFIWFLALCNPVATGVVTIIKAHNTNTKYQYNNSFFIINKSICFLPATCQKLLTKFVINPSQTLTKFLGNFLNSFLIKNRSIENAIIKTN